MTAAAAPPRVMAELELYRAMLRIRLIEEAIAGRYDEQKMRCPVHLSIGQEAAAVGVCAVLRPGDKAFSTHRCHGHYLAMGGDLKAMLAEIYGRAAGCCGGRGGSMHLFDETVGLMASVPIVGSNLPLAGGAALALRQTGGDGIAVAFLGDGAVEEGVWHEVANFAAVHRLPLVVVLENNLYSVYTNLADRQPDRPLTDLALPYRLPALQADGNDVLASRDAMAQAAAHARAGNGPALLVLDTYRWREHCGPNYDNDIGYRSPAEFEAWRERCPVARFAADLQRRGLLDAAADQALHAEIAAEIDAAFAFADAAPYPDPATAAEGLYA